MLGTKKEMQKNNNIEPRTKRLGAPKGDKIEVVKVLVLMVVSFVLGFALVILFLRPSTGADTGQLATASSPESPQEPSSADTPAETSGYAPPDAKYSGYPVPTPKNAPDDSNSDATYDEGTAPPEVPPGKTPEKVAIDGGAFYLKCWDDTGSELKGDDCGRLVIFEKRFLTRLYVVDKCKKKHAGEKEGMLSLGVELDFTKMSISFWNGASSNLENAPLVASCLRTELAGIPITGFNPKYEKYRMFYTVLFGEEAVVAKEKAKPPKANEKDLTRGKLVSVTKNRVRVRRTPVVGDTIGKISSGNQVRLLKEKDGWCQVITPNQNEGWMICDALQK
jgi:hypothetical protein